MINVMYVVSMSDFETTEQDLVQRSKIVLAGKELAETIPGSMNCKHTIKLK